MSVTGPKKLFLLGLDGATFDLIDPWVEQGRLPNLARLLQEGARAPLRSVIPPFTPVAWGTLMTGVNPGKHGVFAFKEMRPGTYSFQLVNNRTLKSKTLWRCLGEQGKRVVVVNIPMTYPPEPVNGILVGGMDSPGLDSDFTYPSALRQEVLRVAPGYSIHLHVGAGYLTSDKKRRRAVEGLLEMAEAREKLVLHLLRSRPWDFFAVNFAAIDQIQHHFWQYLAAPDGSEFEDAILRVYQRVDDAVGRIAGALGADVALLVMSDHGAGASSDQVFFLDEWLSENGYLQFRQTSPIASVRRSMTRGLLTFASRHLSSGLKDRLMTTFPGLRSRWQGTIRRAAIDWDATRVFSGEFPATLRINQRGREPRGTVEAGDCESLRDELRSRLLALRDPTTGEALFEKAYRREELYHGTYCDRAPDLILEPKEFALQVRGGTFPPRRTYDAALSRKDPADFFVSGTHRINGVFIARGDGVRAGAELPPVDMADLFPTILHVLGLAVPPGVDGEVAEGLFEDAVREQRPVLHSEADLRRYPQESQDLTTYEEERDSERVQKALRALGYLE